MACAACLRQRRRYIQRPYRIRIKTKPEDAMILATFALLAITGFMVEAVRIALVGRPDFEKFSFIGYPLSGLVDTWSISALSDAHRWLWAVHVVSFIAFLVILGVLFAMPQGLLGRAAIERV